MQRKFSLLLVASGLATAFVAWSEPGQSVAATGGSGQTVADIDTDGDFLPDVVEWVVLTNSTNPDTDGDQVPDFVEVIEGGNPRSGNAPLPADQQMRLVITGPTPGSGDPLTWMHVFHRVMPAGGATNPGINSIHSFETWLERPEWPGVRFPLNIFAASGVVYRERVTPEDGIWVQLSIPLVDESILQSVSPCTIWAETTVEGQQLSNGQKLIPGPAGLATLIPFGDGRYVIQTLSPIPSTSSSMSIESNRVCVLTLEEDTVGPAGTTYIVTAADCEDANDLECDSSCSQSVGWTITIPGGTELIGGN